MNKLATAMQEGEYDAERPPSKVSRDFLEGTPVAGRSMSCRIAASCGRVVSGEQHAA
jgi:hypothetical protein